MKVNFRLGSRPGLNTALGVIFAVMAGLLLLGYLSRALDKRDGGALTEVPVAARDIEMGAVVTSDAVAMRSIPSGYLVPGSRRRRSDVVGARALRFIGRGEPFVPSAVAGAGGGTLSSRIPADARAYCIELPAGTGPGSDLQPGDRVDVLATYGDPPRTSTLLEARPVLQAGSGGNAGTDGRAGSDGASRLTLLVTPAEAELLAQAETVGRLSISVCPQPPAGIKE
ncbi:MAG: Flp pilus assembly protein CpaB [Gemmatimonadetes bacterium]|nr:Flp pilus assembly protein CpaB [Gemmatimonadota bacterium]